MHPSAYIFRLNTTHIFAIVLDILEKVCYLDIVDDLDILASTLASRIRTLTCLSDIQGVVLRTRLNKADKAAIGAQIKAEYLRIKHELCNYLGEDELAKVWIETREDKRIAAIRGLLNE